MKRTKAWAWSKMGVNIEPMWEPIWEPIWEQIWGECWRERCNKDMLLITQTLRAFGLVRLAYKFGHRQTSESSSPPKFETLL